MAGQWTIEDTPAAGKWVIEDNPTKKPWGDVAVDAARNFPKDALQYGSDIVSAIASPIDTAKGLLTLGQGAAVNAMPDAYINFLNRVNPGLAGKRAQVSDVASSVGRQYKQDYGSVEGFKNKLSDHPVQVLGDVSMVLTGGGAAAGRVPALTRSMATPALTFAGKTIPSINIPSAASILNKGAAYTNPLNIVNPVAKVSGAVAKPLFGMTSGMGSDTVAAAGRAGMAGDKSFPRNMSGKVPMTDVVDDAFRGIERMKKEAGVAYQNSMAPVKADGTILDFTSIDKAFTAEINSLKVISRTTGKRQFKVDADQLGPIKKIEDAMATWRADRGLHTPEGLDALKIRIGSVTTEHGSQAARIQTSAYNSVKDSIIKQSPGYRGTMEAYESAKTLENELRKTLSLSEKATDDTILRKLQSVARNNVNTNYGQRLNLLKTLEEKGGVNLQNALAGQMASTWSPRGLVSQSGAMGTTLASVLTGNPGALAMLPAMSPRLVGSAAYYGARPVGVANRAINKLGVSVDDMLKYGMLTEQAGRDRQ